MARRFLSTMSTNKGAFFNHVVKISENASITLDVKRILNMKNKILEEAHKPKIKYATFGDVDNHILDFFRSEGFSVITSSDGRNDQFTIISWEKGDDLFHPLGD